MRCGLCVHIDCYNRLRWSFEHERGTNEHTEHVCDMPGGARLCRRGVATDIVLMQPRVLLSHGRHRRCDDLHWYNGKLRCLRDRCMLPRKQRAPGALYVLPRLGVHRNDVK